MNVISLFAGCGGLDLGFEKAGFKIIWANEFDKTIHSTYKLNHPNTAFCEEDIRSINTTDIPDCDGIIGGPPCQSWSVGGKGRGIQDDRGKLFFNYIHIVEQKKPKFFVIENVAGILEEKHKQVFTLFLTLLGNVGYNVKCSLLNAADYSIPQDRFRVFIVGIRKDLDVNFHFPEKREGAKITLKQAIGDINEEPQFSGGLITIKQTNLGLWNHDVYNGPYSPNYMHSNRVRSWNEVSYTIQAQASNAPQHPQAPKMEFSPNGGRMFKVGYEHLYRRLSVRECARIQAFPDSFRLIYNNVKDGYKMIGNAVPPRLAYFLGLQLMQAFKEKGGAVRSNKKHNIKTIESIGRGLIKTNQNIGDFNLDAVSENIEKDNVLIGLVKKDFVPHFSNQKGNIYYSGRRFPSTINLDDLCYFMPYIPGKGVRDLYYIETIKTGTKEEIIPTSKDSDLRVIFEIKFIKQIFRDFIPIHLNVWYTFTQMSINKLATLSEEIEGNEIV